MRSSCGPAERGNFDRRAQGRLAVADGQAEDEVRAFALENLVLFDGDEAVAIAGRAARSGLGSP